MKTSIYITLAALLTLGSCNNDDLAIENITQNGVIHATFEQGVTASRLSIGTNNALSWSANDCFALLNNNSSYYYTTTEGGETATFTGTIPSENIDIAVFPADANSNPQFNNSEHKLTITLPAILNQETEGNCNLPMWASVSSPNEHITFKHLAGVLRVSLADLPVGYKSLTVTASNPISGVFTATTTDNQPILKSTSNHNEDKKITVNFTKTTTNNKNAVLYLPLPVGEYTSINVAISNGTNTKTLASWNNRTIERAKIYTASLTYQEVNASTPGAVSTALNSINTSSVQLALTNTINATESNAGEINVPNTLSNLDMIFSNVPTTTSTAPLVINSNKEATSTTASQTLNIDIPNNNGVYLQLNTPTTTATLSGGTYEDVSATTATNTLIINGGVTIKKLTIYGGNVLIEAGAQIEEIDNKSTGIINYIVKSEEGLMKAFENGGKYMVYNDFTITKNKEVNIGTNKSVVLNLNNKTITSAGNAFIANTGTTLTLNGNGFVKAGNTIGSWTAVCANGGKVTINDGNYTVGLDNGNSNSCVYVKNGGQVTINGGEYSHEIPASGNNYGMPLQIEDNDTEGKITVNGGVFVLDNGRYYEEKDTAQITFTATETINNGKAIISGAFGKTIIIENTQLSDALYKLYGDVYYITINSKGYAEMRESEVLDIKFLDFDSYKSEYKCGITTLKGIEVFKNLEELVCRNDSLTVCDLSQNTALKSFAAQNTKLTSLDFSNNPNLTTLYMNYNPHLASLNLAGCTKLSAIQLFGSALTSLEIPNKKDVTNLLIGNSLSLTLSEFINLSGLGCENMGLTDLSIIPEEVKGKLTMLSCAGNQLTELDLSQYPELRTLDCGNNQITNLNLSSVPYLSDLYCHGNKIRTLDITGCTGLNYLFCGYQQDNIKIDLTLTENQKTILIDNGYMNPTNENITLNIQNAQ